MNVRWLLALASLPLATGFLSVPKAKDPTASLGQQVREGKVKLAYEPGTGYLRSLLKELGIDPRSQVLVFSKSSLQADFIGPKTPRAMYFNEHTYVGWIPGAPLIEIMSVDPKEGTRFYSIPNKPAGTPSFVEERSACLPCHFNGALVARSSPTPASGYPRAMVPSVPVTHRTPIAQRWGGWYVSGTHGSIRHQGNEFSVGDDERFTQNVERGANVTDLRRYFDPKGYLTPHSDIAALMVMEHQMAVQNVMNAVARRAGYTDDLTETVEPLVAVLLGRGEAKFDAPLKGTSGFAEAHAKTGPRDAKGRSLTELDMTRRVYRYGVSPLITSETFRSMPVAARQEVYRQIRTILTSDVDGFAHLSQADKTVALEVLTGIIPEFAVSVSSERSAP